MKDGRNATQAELNYALRRIVYDTMVAAKAVAAIRAAGRDYSAKEMAKMSALIMVRNLDAFLFLDKHDRADDISVTDFTLSDWEVSSNAALTSGERRRIHKIAGHIVASEPRPFKDNDTIWQKILLIIEEARDFVRNCLAEEKAKYTGKAPYYVRRLNGLLRQIGLRQLPEPRAANDGT